MSMTDRDRKILLLIVPAVILAAYWFLLLSPKREEAAVAGQEVAVQEQRRDDAQARLASVTSARTGFAADYAELVRLGKAVPTRVDMPTVLVQLEDAARGTGIEFVRITAQERESAAPVAPPPGSDSSGSEPAAAGGAPAQSAPGAAGESAGNAVAAADTQTSQTASEGSLPVGGGAVATGVGAGGAPPALDTVGLELEFTGDFFDLSAFFHRIKRYVELDGDDLDVRGRLLTVDNLELKSEPDTFPRLTATLAATAYLAPEIEGATAGATPSGPALTPASTGEPVPLATSTPTTNVAR
jgi:Tfp pilus assembly protein PilO